MLESKASSPSYIFVAVVLVALAMRMPMLARGIFYDDGMIALRVSENIATGHGFSYNPGEHVQAASSLAWAFLGATVYELYPSHAFGLMRAFGVLFDSLAAG